MPLIDWNADLRMDIATIDDQHECFVDFINRLYAVRRDRTKSTDIGSLIGELAEYARIHFKTEEMYFEMYDYPDFDQHKKEHDQLLNRIDELRDQYVQGENLFVAMQLANFLNSWFQNHLMLSDRKYASFFRENGLVI